MRYNVISGDSHIDMTWMPGDLWVDRAPAEFKPIAPRVVESNEGLHWEAEGKRLGVFGGTSFTFGAATRGQSKRLDAVFDTGFLTESRGQPILIFESRIWNLMVSMQRSSTELSE